jgi:CubicO group peptidase (beta-lactamase class C family)
MSSKSPFYTVPTSKETAVISGGGGMVGTAMDFARFGQMLLNGGELDGVRLLSPTTVALATADHLGELGHRSDSAYVPGVGHGQGFGVYVRTSVGGAYTPGNVGEYYKQGIAGTLMWVDPKEELVAVFMVTSTSQREYVRYMVKDMIYQAIVE